MAVSKKSHIFAPGLEEGGRTKEKATAGQRRRQQQGKGERRFKLAPYALKGQKLLAQGNALGIKSTQQKRPERAKALKYTWGRL